MISRQWKGIIKAEAHNQYITFLKEIVFEEAKALPGFQSAHIYRRPLDLGYEFLIATEWTDLESIKAFAGEDIEKAVVPPEAQKMMISFDKTVSHYQIEPTH